MKNKDLNKISGDKEIDNIEKIKNDELGEIAGGLNNQIPDKIAEIVGECPTMYGKPLYGVSAIDRVRWEHITDQNVYDKDLNKIKNDKGGELCEKGKR